MAVTAKHLSPEYDRKQKRVAIQNKHGDVVVLKFRSRNTANRLQHDLEKLLEDFDITYTEGE